MSYDTKTLITDVSRKPVPQYYNETTDGYEVIKGSNGAAYMQIVGSNVAIVTFHNAATVAADGAVIAVDGYKTLTAEIYGTSTTRAISFIGVGPSGNPLPIMGVKLADLSAGVSTTGTGEMWQFDITGLISVYMDLTAVTGGNVSVKGKVVA